jgi:hypothetical protein
MESFEKQFTDTLAIRGLSPKTQVVYVPMLRDFARFVGKPLDAVVPEDLRNYQRHLAVERQVGFSHFNQSACALRLFFRECLGRTDWPFERIAFQKKRRILPEILSRTRSPGSSKPLQSQAQGRADDSLQRWVAPRRDPRSASERHRLWTYGDPGRAGQGRKDRYDALQDLA